MKIGIINEKKLVNLFATKNQKQKYLTDSKFTGVNKSILLKEASRYCEFDDLGNRNYKITKVYKYPKPKTLSKMQNGLYQYMIPLILNKLIDGHNENNKITLTSIKWARQIKMINGNYNAVKYHKQVASSYFDYNYNEVNDFYDKADDMIIRQLEQSLKYMTDAGLILWGKVDMVYKEKFNEKIVDISNGNNITLDKIEDTHVLTEEEKGYYAECIKIADVESGAEDKQGRYFGEHAKKFNEVLNRELLKKNIKFVYQAYEVYYIDLDKCKDFLNNFDNVNNISFIDNFNNEFQKMIIDNAETRYNKDLDKQIKKYSEDYIDTFKNLSDMTINHNAESVWSMLNINGVTDYTLQVNRRKGLIKYEE